MDQDKAQEFRLLMKKGHEDEALAMVTDLFRTSMAEERLEEASQALVRMAHILEARGKSTAIEGRARRLKSLALKKKALWPYMGFARARLGILVEQGRMKKARALIEEMEDMGWRKLAILCRAEMALAQGSPPLALRLVERYPVNDLASFIVKARALAGTGRFEEALAFLEGEVIGVPALDNLRKQIMGFCLICKGQYSRARMCLEESLEESKRAHGEIVGIADGLVSLGVVWAAMGDPERAGLYWDIAEISSAKTGRLKGVLEIRALREAVLPEGVDSLIRALEVAEEARKKGFGVARMWAFWAGARIAEELGLEKEWREHLTASVRMAKESELWGYLTYISHAGPRPLALALSIYPSDERIKKIAARTSGVPEVERVRLRLMGRPVLETPRGKIFLERDRAAELLVYFALMRKTHLTREMVIREFWPEIPFPKAKRNYYKFTALARALLKNHGITVKPDKSHDSTWIGCEIQVDLDEIRNLVNMARAMEALAMPQAARRVYERAFCLVGGDFLEGWGPDRLRFMTRAREEAGDLAALVRIKMADYFLEHDPEESLKLAKKVLSDRPFSEDACERAVLALLRLGRPEKAKALYEDFVEGFEKELGLRSRLTWPPPGSSPPG